MAKTSFIDSQIEKIRKEYPVLSRQDEKELAEKMKAGNTKARDILFFTAMGLIRTEVRQFHIGNASYEDLMQDAYEIMLSKMKDFNEKKGFRFSTFIWPWVWQGLMNRNLSISSRDYLFSRQVAKAQDILCQEKGKTPSDVEIAEYLEMDYSDYVKKMSRISGTNIVSLDAPISTVSSKLEENGTFMDFAEDEKNGLPEEQLLKKEAEKIFAQSLEKLSDKEKAVFVMCHGCNLNEAGKKISYHKAGEALSLSHEGVRGVDKKAKEKVYRYLETQGFFAA